MIIEDIKLQHSDRSDINSPFNYNNRIMRIDTNIGRFYTPSRVITKYEYNSRSSFPLSKCLPLALAMDFTSLTHDQVKEISQDPLVGKGLVNNTMVFNNITTNALFRISIFQPPIVTLKQMSSSKKIQFADLQAKYLQKNLGSEIITYPYLELPLTEYLEFIKTRYTRDEKTNTIFTLDMKMPSRDLSKIIEYFASRREPTIIPLIHHDWTQTIPQHIVINSFMNAEKIVFFACQVDREERINGINNLHPLASAAGFDLVSLKQSRGFKNDNDEPKLDLSKLKFFNPQNLALENINRVLSNNNRDLLKELHLSIDESGDFEYVNTVLKGYRGGAVHPLKYRKLYDLCKIHEAITSSELFDTVRERILLNETRLYIEETNLKLSPIVKPELNLTMKYKGI